MEPEIDAADRIILESLQADARLPQAALGARAGLSAAAVNRRIRRLSDSGCITRTAAVLAPDRLGHALTVIANIEVVSERPDDLSALEAAFVASPNVQQCYYVTGEWDFVLILVVRDMDQYLQLTRELFFGSDNVKRFKSLVVMNRAKVTLDVPVG